MHRTASLSSPRPVRSPASGVALSSVLKSWRGLLLKLAVARFKRFVRRSLDY
jgi:hypothetical protein